LIYLDYNATTPLHPRVLEVMLPFLQEKWGNPSSPYRFGNEARGAIERSRKRIAGYFGCKPCELVFCSSGTEADNLALRGVVHALKGKGNHIITSVIEHHAVLNTCKALEGEGFRVTYLPVTDNGVVEVAELEKVLDDETILVSVMHANNETGVVQPVEDIAALTREHGIIFHVDAVQTIGKLPRRIAELGADLITISGHKFYGPKGTAALYVRQGVPLGAVTTGGRQEHNLRAGTENVAGIVGFAEAVSLAFESVEAEGQRLRELRDRFEKQILALVPGVRINGAQASRVPNTSNMTFASVDGESIVLGMDLNGICISTGSACSTGDPEPSHVLRAMGISAREAQGSVRISLGRSTQETDIEAALMALKAVVERLRGISSIDGNGQSR